MASKKTIILKLSGSLLQSQESAVDMLAVVNLAQEIKKIHKDYKLGIVFGGGNIFRGRHIKELGLDMTTAHFTGMTATLVNALALKNALDFLDIPCQIISALSYPQVIGATSHLDVKKYLSQGEVLIFAAGTGNPFVTTDTAAVIRALEARADFILKGTNVKGIYDRNPNENPDAIQFKKINYSDYLELTDAFILDKTAAVLAQENKLPIYIFKWGAGQLKKAVKFRAGGTLIN